MTSCGRWPSANCARDGLREKKYYRNNFDLSLKVHGAEYQSIKRPVNPRNKETIEPAHKFEVTLEEDTFTEEKCKSTLKLL